MTVKKYRAKSMRLGYALLFLALSGCAPVAKFAVGSRGLEIPHIVAYLEPALRDNKVIVSGKIVIHNPTESALDLDKIRLTIKDENDAVLASDILEWERPQAMAKADIESKVRFDLSLSSLDKKFIAFYLQTAFTYKLFNIRIPVESKIAVLGLDALRETIARPLNITIYTKLQSKIFGYSSVEYLVNIANPFSIDVVLENARIRVHTEDGLDIAESTAPAALLTAYGTNKIAGSIEIGNIFRKLIRLEVAQRRPLRFQLSGVLRVPDTNISMPFNIESVQEIHFSFLDRLRFLRKN